MVLYKVNVIFSETLVEIEYWVSSVSSQDCTKISKKEKFHFPLPSDKRTTYITYFYLRLVQLIYLNNWTKFPDLLYRCSFQSFKHTICIQYPLEFSRYVKTHKPNTINILYLIVVVSYHSIYLHFHAHLNSNQQVVCLLKFCGKHHIYLSIKHTFCEALTCFTLPINKRKHISTNLCWCSQQNHTSIFPNKIQNKFTSRNSFTILYVIIKLYNILPQTIWVIKFC